MAFKNIDGTIWTEKGSKEDLTMEECRKLPWINEWCKKNKDRASEPLRIQVVSIANTGNYMVFTTEWKGILKEGSTKGDELMEAIQVLHEEQVCSHVFYACCPDKRTPTILINDEEFNHRWYRTEDNFVQVLPGEKEQKRAKKENRLLAGRGVRNTHTHADASEGVDEPSNAQIPAATNGKKAP